MATFSGPRFSHAAFSGPVAAPAPPLGPPLLPARVEIPFVVRGPEFISDPYGPQVVKPARIEIPFLVRGPLVAPAAVTLQSIRPKRIEIKFRVRGPEPFLTPPTFAAQPAALTVSGVADVESGSVTPAMNDKGSGQFTAATVPGVGTEVAMAFGGAQVLVGVVESSEFGKIEDSEYAVSHTANVVGHLREWDKVVVWPDFGASKPSRLGSPVQDTRFFDFTMNGGVTEEDDFNGTGTYGRDVMQAALDPNPKDRLALPDNWPDNFAQWMWCTKPGAAASGWVHFRVKTTAGSGPCSWWTCSYDYSETWVDGVLLHTNDQAGTAVHTEMDASPHNHLIVIKAHNGGGRAGVLFTAMPKVGGRYVEPLVRSSGGWLTSGYGRNPRPFGVGGVLHRIFDEAQKRGELSGWNLDFSPETDSIGRPWPKPEETITLDVGMTYREVLDRFAENLLDFRVDGRNIAAVNKGANFPGGGSVPWTTANGKLLSAGSQATLR